MNEQPPYPKAMPSLENNPQHIDRSEKNYPLADIRKRCQEDISHDLTVIEGHIAKGNNSEGTVYSVGLTYLDLAEEAADLGDIATVHEYIDRICKLPEAPKDLLTKICFVGLSLGSEKSNQVLRGLLEAERLRVEESVAKQKAETPFAIRPIINCEVLGTIIDVCKENDYPPEKWIDEYAHGKEHAWQLRTEYFARMYHTHPEFKQNLCGELEKLLDDQTFDREFVYSQINSAFFRVDDPGIKRTGVMRFKEILNNHDAPFSYADFSQLLNVANRTLESGIATQEDIDYFEAIINMFSRQFQEAGVDPARLDCDQFGWRIGLKAFSGTNPQEMVKYIDTLTGQLMNYNMPEHLDFQDYNSFFYNKEAIEANRNSLLHICSQTSVRNGDFAAAGYFLQQISDSSRKIASVRSCLSKVTTNEELEALKPHTMTLEFEPELAVHFELREAEIEQDIAKIHDILFEFADTITDANCIDYCQYIEDAFARITTEFPSQIPEIAKTILQALEDRQLPDQTATLYQNIAEELIAQGDTTQAYKTYKRLNLMTRPISCMRHKMRLAQFLGRQSAIN